jgi:hypothetical protein
MQSLQTSQNTKRKGERRQILSWIISEQRHFHFFKNIERDKKKAL